MQSTDAPTTSLLAMPTARVKEIVAILPAAKRPAMAKVLKAACQHLRDSRENYAQAFGLAEAMIENWWRLGNDLQAIIPHGGGQPKKNPTKMEGSFKLSELGVTYNQSSRSQKLAETDLSELLKTVAALRDEEKFFLPSLHTLHQHIHVGANSGRFEWYTPADYIEAARKTMGGIDLDPASCKFSQKRIQAATFYSEDDDGLARQWTGRVWLNPPYAKGVVNDFVGKLCEHYEAGDVTAAILCVNNSTETEWLQQAMSLASGACFPLGRIRFENDNYEGGGPLQGQVLVYFGKSVTKFHKHFDSFGSILLGRT